MEKTYKAKTPLTETQWKNVNKKKWEHFACKYESLLI